jgi:hypothetical protein
MAVHARRPKRSRVVPADGETSVCIERLLTLLPQQQVELNALIIVSLEEPIFLSLADVEDRVKKRTLPWGHLRATVFLVASKLDFSGN